MRVNDDQKSVDITPMEFKKPRRLPRTVFLFVLAFFLIALVSLRPVFSKEELADVRTKELITLGVLHILPLAFLFFLPRVRVRVDSAGVHCGFFRMSHCWPWEDFAEGRVLWDRVLGTWRCLDCAVAKGGFSLRVLTEEDAKRVGELIDQIWQEPPMPEPPAELMLLVSKGLLSVPKHVKLVSTGIETDWDGPMRTYQWWDVREVSLQRLTHVDQGFEILRIVLPDAEIRLEVGKNDNDSYRSTNWGGADVREIVAFFIKYAPEEKFKVGALAGPPRSLRDFDERLPQIDKRLRNARIIAAVCWFLLMGLGLVGAIILASHRALDVSLKSLSVAMNLLVVAPFVGLIGLVGLIGVGLFRPRIWRKRRRELEAEREKFLEEHGAEAGGAER